MYLAFFIFCVVSVGITTVSVNIRRKALLIGCLCLGMAYLVEVNGVRNHDWSYAEVNSMMRITDIPVEILFGYFTAAFFLVVMVTYLPRVSTRERRREVMQYLCLGTGVVLLAYAYTYRSISILVGWSFLGMFGLSVARDRTIPFAVGLGAFMSDWAIEGMLTARMEYYSNGWDPTIGLVFMFAGMFISGGFTHVLLPVEGVQADHIQERVSRKGRVEPVHLYAGGPLTSHFSQVMVRKS